MIAWEYVQKERLHFGGHGGSVLFSQQNGLPAEEICTYQGPAQVFDCLEDPKDPCSHAMYTWAPKEVI